jgi:uncharacterized protein (TIGR03437 family)
VPLIVSSANPSSTAIAPGSLATANGAGLATATSGSTPLTLATTFGGSSVSIVDSTGKTFAAPLLYVSPTQINFEFPSDVAAGTAKVTITSGDGTKSTANVQVVAAAPGLFTLNGSGLAAAYAVRVAADGTQTPIEAYTIGSGGAIVANPISLGASTDKVYLILFGTGLPSASSSVTVTVNGVNAPVLYAGPGGGFAGLDQFNVLLPASLAGKGNVNVQLTAGGVASNPVQVTIQ